jgi:translation initiation factor 3 subunit H
MATQSMAAALAASLPAPVIPQAEAQPQVTKVPQRLEGVVDPEALRDVESVSLNALVRILHQSLNHFGR